MQKISKGFDLWIIITQVTQYIVGLDSWFSQLGVAKRNLVKLELREAE